MADESRLIDDWLTRKPRRENFPDDATHDAALSVWRDKLARALAACGVRDLNRVLPMGGRASTEDWRG